MREFFNGWKRKMGVVTLTLALLSTAGWVRSVQTFDQISIHLADRWRPTIVSFHQRIYMFNGTNYGGGLWKSMKIEFEAEARFFEAELDSRTKWPPPNPEAYLKNYGRKRGWVIPCWSAVASLTVVSGYLLLGRPRQAKPLPDQAI